MEDVTRIQAVMRRKQCKRDVEARRAARDQEAARTGAADVAPITMPEDSDDDEAAAGPTSAATTTVLPDGSVVFVKKHVGRRPAPTGAPLASGAAAKGGASSGRFSKAAAAGELKIAEDKGRDTQGMHHVYSRMLHTKDWW